MQLQGIPGRIKNFFIYNKLLVYKTPKTQQAPTLAPFLLFLPSRFSEKSNTNLCVSKYGK